MAKAKVDLSKCIGCGACVTACPNEAITVGEKAKIDAAKCKACGSCVSVCALQALSLG